MRRFGPALCVVSVFVVGITAAPTRAAVQYPLALTLDAALTSGVTTITTKVKIRVERAMLDGARKRVSDALQHGGYSNFVNTLRPVAAVGSIETPTTTVEIRYTREEADGAGSRLILVADRPIYFAKSNTANPGKPTTGFDLTVVDLRIDEKGGVTGQMAGAARVRPAPDGTVLLDKYAEELVQLKGRVGGPPF
jgi:hypothetical protein